MLTVVRLNMKRIFKNKIYNPMPFSLLGWGPLGNDPLMSSKMYEKLSFIHKNILIFTGIVNINSDFIFICLWEKTYLTAKSVN